ncbi:MAG: GreA/GreB family elongation factor [Phycisphaerae bacterium]
MVKPKELAKLARDGNVKTVEEEWLKIVEAGEAETKRLADYAPVLQTLKKGEQAELAGTLAWAAFESVSTAFEAKQAIAILGPLVQALGNHKELREEITKLYQSAYEGAEGLEALLAEAGLPEGRPVRRALRTVTTCIELQPGDYLVSRDAEEDEAAKIVSVDRSSWEFEIETPDGTEDAPAVELADRFVLTGADDFRIRRKFFREELMKQFDTEPAEIVIALAKLHGGQITRDELEWELVPKYFTAAQWKKWWTKARTALKKFANVTIDRKSPYNITFLDKDVTAADLHMADLSKVFDPIKKYEKIETYLKECKALGEDVELKEIATCHGTLVEQAKRLIKSGSLDAGLVSIIARRVGEVAGVENANEPALELFKTTDKLRQFFLRIDADELHELACETLIEARPDAWTSEMLSLLPFFPLSACERESKRLLEAGHSKEEFLPVLEQAFADPVPSFEALLWLWNGPEQAEKLPSKPAVAVLTRLLRAMDEVRRSDSIDRELAKRIGTRARAVLAARKYERFKALLDDTEISMASALKTQITRLDNLGRAVREDLLKLIKAGFPGLSVKPEAPAWEREDLLLVTRDGYSRKQDEIDHHVNVKMKDNARAIGEAAEHGDLSENSEYKFALEERDLLRARLAQMNAEMAIAKIIDPDEVPTDHIGVGTRAVFRRIDDEDVFEMIMVGPWESDPDQSKYNYRAPLCQKILGAKRGEVIEFDFKRATGQYELVELTNGLAERAENEA